MIYVFKSKEAQVGKILRTPSLGRNLLVLIKKECKTHTQTLHTPTHRHTHPDTHTLTIKHRESSFTVANRAFQSWQNKFFIGLLNHYMRWKNKFSLNRWGGLLYQHFSPKGKRIQGVGKNLGFIKTRCPDLLVTTGLKGIPLIFWEKTTIPPGAGVRKAWILKM